MLRGLPPLCSTTAAMESPAGEMSWKNAVVLSQTIVVRPSRPSRAMASCPPRELTALNTTDGDRAHLLLVAIPCTNAVAAECVGELGEPLCDERAGRRDDACATAQLVNGHECHEGLAGARWQDDRPARPRRLPAIDGVALVAARRTRIQQRDVDAIRFRLHLRDAVLRPPCSQLSEAVARCDERVEPRIVHEPPWRVGRVHAAQDGEAESV